MLGSIEDEDSSSFKALKSSSPLRPSWAYLDRLFSVIANLALNVQATADIESKASLKLP